MAPSNPPVAPKVAPKAQPSGATGVLVLADGTILWGAGYGASGAAVGEICFNTSMTGYQEILPDPSYAGQIVTFTFPHIGNVGANTADVERNRRAAIGENTRGLPTAPSDLSPHILLPACMDSEGLQDLAGRPPSALPRSPSNTG